MININLARKDRRDHGDADFSGSRDKLSEIFGVLAKAVLVTVICIGANHAKEIYIGKRKMEFSGNQTAAEKMIAAKEAELKSMEALLDEKGRVESSVKDAGGRLSKLKELIKDRDVGYLSLVELSKNIPEDIWLSEFSWIPEGFVIRGTALDLGSVSDFMGRLEKAQVFKDVVLKTSGADPLQPGKLAFELTARRQQ